MVNGNFNAETAKRTSRADNTGRFEKTFPYVTLSLIFAHFPEMP